MTETAPRPVRIILGSSVLERDDSIARMITSGRGSLAFILGDEACRYRLLARSINWDRVLIAYCDTVALGYAAFKHHRRGPFSPGIEPFFSEFGRFMGALRYALFIFFECREWSYGFYLYGLRVIKPARHQGVATALLTAIFDQARQSGHDRVELEVQLKNQRAQTLYTRQGFVNVRTIPLGRLGRLLAFPAVMNMRRPLITAMSRDDMNRSAPVVESLVDGHGRIGIMSQWVMWRIFHLAEFLTPQGTPAWLWRRGQKKPEGLKAIAGIGYKRSSDHARVLCKRWNIPYIALEDGFLRSSSLGVEGDTPMSMVVDPIGIHYLSSRPSLLENILQQPQQLTCEELSTATELIALMRSSGIGKYNNAPDLNDDDPLGRERPLVLVVDQTYGDFSISGGGLCEEDFIRMLDTALAENPDADVRVRIHPDCLSGHKKSCLLEAATERGVTLESRQVSWASLARRAVRVYIATSQAGLEALIQGVPVTCFGLPFYAGWGLTDDRLPIPRRQARPTLPQLIAAAYIRYCRYVDPLTDQRCDVMTVARQLARQKQQDSQFCGEIIVFGVPRRQQPTIRSLLYSRWGNVTFARKMTAAACENRKVLVWSAGESHDLSSGTALRDMPLWRIRPGTTDTSLILTSSDGDEQLLVHLRGMPCSQRQAQEYSTQPKPGLLDSCPRYQQVRRYLTRMFSL